VACIARWRRAPGCESATARWVGAVGDGEVWEGAHAHQRACFSMGESKFCRSPNGACMTGDEFGGRESIFWICHTNEFSGWGVLAPEPTRACWGVIQCRRDYERGKKKVGGDSDLAGSSGLSGGFQRSAPRTRPLRRLRGGQRPCGQAYLAVVGSNLTKSVWCVRGGR